jgi:thioredoxin 1
LAAQLADHPEIEHLKIYDGRGKPLGRSFQVKLWPTLVFLRDGHVVQRAVRPDADEIRQGIEALTNTVEAR